MAFTFSWPVRRRAGISNSMQDMAKHCALFVRARNRSADTCADSRRRREVNGSRRWLSLLVFNLQPSELMKLFVVLYAADYTVRKGVVKKV